MMRFGNSPSSSTRVDDTRLTLPKSHTTSATSSSSSASASTSAFYLSRPFRKKHKFVRRLFQFNQMDFEVALSQMINLLIAPSKVYRTVYYHKNTKNQWARDDPAFLVLLAAFLTLSSLLYMIVFKLSFVAFLKLWSWVVFVDCIGFGLVVALVLWSFSNAFLREKPSAHRVEQSVEYAYAFDVHMNAFFPVFVILHIVQLFLLKVISKPWFLSSVLSDTLWAFALGYYVYITFLGYSALPFLKNTRFFLAPMAVIVLFFVIAILMQWNVSLVMFELYGLVSDPTAGTASTSGSYLDDITQSQGRMADNVGATGTINTLTGSTN